MLLDNQNYVSTSRGMPTEAIDDSKRVRSVSGETVQFYYDSSGTPTVDAGQVVGTVVAAKFAQGSILNFLGDMPASNNDTSLSFTSTAATTEVPLPTDYDSVDRSNFTDRLTLFDAHLQTDGDYCVDYVHGIAYIKKASTQVSLTATSYSVASRGSASGGSVNQEVDAFTSSASDVTLANTPNEIYFYADEDCHINFTTTATAALPDIKIIKNILYGPFPFGDATFSVIRDSADGNLASIYTY